MRAATRLVDADTRTNDHHRAREPEQRRNADANSAQHAVAVAHRERHTDDRPSQPDTNATWARPLLRRR